LPSRQASLTWDGDWTAHASTGVYRTEKAGREKEQRKAESMTERGTNEGVVFELTCDDEHHFSCV